MMKWTSHRITVAILGFWIAFAPAVLVMPATPIAVQMSMSDGAVPGDCSGCPDSGMDRHICVMMCANALTFASAPDLTGIGPVTFGHVDWPVRQLLLVGFDLVPDPGPPRSV